MTIALFFELSRNNKRIKAQETATAAHFPVEDLVYVTRFMVSRCIAQVVLREVEGSSVLPTHTHTHSSYEEHTNSRDCSCCLPGDGITIVSQRNDLLSR